MPIAWADDPPEISVKIDKIRQATLRRYVRAFGVLEAEPNASAKIAAPVAGIVSKVICEEGQRVTKGQKLFVLDSRVMDSQLTKARTAVDFAQKNFVRKQQLNAADNVARKLYDEAANLLHSAQHDLQATEVQRELQNITTPLTGTVLACHIKAGEAVGLTTILAEVLDLRRLNIALRIPSAEASALRLKQTVLLTPELRAKVVFIGSQVDPLTDTVLVRASVPADAQFRAGQLVNAAIVVEERQTLAVPVTSVVQNHIAIVTENIAKQHEVTLGLRDGDLIEIQGEGLQEGMTIVTQGSYGLPTETRVRVLQ
jgi:membrane fusion protein (multidrug efflux system)